VSVTPLPREGWCVTPLKGDIASLMSFSKGKGAGLTTPKRRLSAKI